MSKPGLLYTSIGDYRLVDFLGAGGMGEVYRAVNSRTGKVVAVKVLTLTGQGRSFIERFHNEARIQSALHHKNIAAMYELLVHDGMPCIIMEYIDGQALSDRIGALGALPTADALYVLEAVAEAIQHIHEQGIIHRDIKSNNIKISSTGEVKLLDFGIAKGGSTPSLTVTGDVVGTLQYLSPEQVKGGAADVRSDIWALGTLLYEMITGAPPFQAQTIGDLCDRICKAPPPPLTSLNPNAPREVEAIIARCLKKKPSERYQTALDLLQDIKQLSGRAPANPAEAGGENSGRPLFNRVYAAAAAGVILVIVAGLYLAWPSFDTTSRPPVNSLVAGNVNTPAGPLKPYRIDTLEGQAEVYINGQYAGTTPYEVQARPGERIALLLKREGFEDRREEFQVTENKKVYTFSLQRKR